MLYKKCFSTYFVIVKSGYRQWKNSHTPVPDNTLFYQSACIILKLYFRECHFMIIEYVIR
jgi:hypothetical protein